MKQDPIGWFFESLVLPCARPYGERAASAQQRVAELLHRVGDPHRKLRCVHIVGSKGKGSTALYAEAIAEGAGVRTATFTSPHLESWNERFRIRAKPIDDSSLLAAIEKLRPHVISVRDQHRDDPPTFFDTLTALGLMLFADAEVDLAIIEAGIGARLDATTIAPAIVTCVTSIEKEHTDKLGNTLEQIATEKAGVIRSATPLVLGKLTPSVERILHTRAKLLGAPTAQLGRDFHASTTRIDTTHTMLHFARDTETLEMVLPQPAPYVSLNAALALECILQTRLAPTKKIYATAPASLNTTHLPARVEILKSDPVIVIDGAHTVVSMTYLAEMLKSFHPSCLLAVLSLTKAKDVDQVFAPLQGVVSRVIATSADPIRSMSAHALGHALARLWPHKDVVIIDQPERALELAHTEHLEHDRGVCVTGSVYLAGKARRVLRGLLGEG